MSFTKRKKERQDDYYKKAKEILLEIGEISLCKKHPDETFFYRTYTLEESQIYGIATNKLKMKYPDDNYFTEFHEQVNCVLKDAALSQDDCPVCRKIRED